MTRIVAWSVVRRAAPWLVAAACSSSRAAPVDPLPSWNDGEVKQRIVAFVNAVTDTSGPNYVPPGDRVAAFDDDGTLWTEQPIYVQMAFMLDQLKTAAPMHPEWQASPAFKAIVTRDEPALARIGDKPILALLAEATSGMTVEEYDAAVRDWLQSARHPTLNRAYTELVYVPMQELLRYLRANGFQTFIVSGGSAEFMRPWSAKSYGVLPEQIVGSVSEVKYETREGVPVLVREPRMEFMDDGPGKPVGIYRAIGRRPIAAFGNSDGDLEMLQFTAAGPGKRLVVIVHHDDAEREFAYDRRARVGKLDQAWDQAKARDWTIVSMRADWRRIFAFQ